MRLITLMNNNELTRRDFKMKTVVKEGKKLVEFSKKDAEEMQDQILADILQKRNTWAELGAQIHEHTPEDWEENVEYNPERNGTDEWQYYEDLQVEAESARKEYFSAVKDAAKILNVSNLKGELASLRRINRDLDTKFLREKEQQILWQRQWAVEAFLCGWLDRAEYRKL